MLGTPRFPRGAALSIALALLLIALALPAAAGARARFDIQVLAHVPPPGYPALTQVAPDGTIYASTFMGPSGGDNGPAKVFAFSPAGRLLRSYTIAGETPGVAHGVQVAAIDATGLLYLLDQAPARIVTLDPSTGRQATYATFADVPTCQTAPTARDCSATVQDNPPEPDFAAFAPDGSLYVTDYQQGLIWRVAPGGGPAHVWFTDPRIDGSVFGPAGLVLMPDHRTLMFDNASGGVTTPGNPTTGKLYTLPIAADGRPGTLTKVWESGPREAPDGFALARSGDVYVSLVGPGANQIVELSPTGAELARLPSATQNAMLPVPFDEPSSVQFDGDRLIVTNDAYFSGDQSHMVLFDVFAGEPGQPLFVPPAPLTPGQHGRVSYALRLGRRRVPVGRRVRLRVRATVTVAGRRRPLVGAIVTIGRRRARTGRRGYATLTVRFTRGERRLVRLRLAGAPQVLAAVTLTARRTSRRHRGAMAAAAVGGATRAAPLA